MRLEWLEDLLAVIETGSFNAAAERRHTTQPAFSRRMKSLEEYVGADLFDRSHKPVRPSQVVLDQQSEIQSLATGLRTLLHELRRQERDSWNRIVISSQHSLATLHAPELVKRLSAETDLSISMRLGTRDECYAMLLAREADIVLAFRAVGIRGPTAAEFFEHVDIGMERLTPVCAPSIRTTVDADYARSRVNAISYPPDAFLGRVVAQKVVPKLPSNMYVHNRVESAVTLAVAQFAVTGLGVAWIPHSVVKAELASGELVDLSGQFPTFDMTVVAGRLVGSNSALDSGVWRVVNATASEPEIA